MPGTSLGMTERVVLMFCRLHQISDDRLLAQRLAGFQTVQALHQHETVAVAPHQDRALLPGLENALGELLHGRGLERRAALCRHIDVGDREFFTLHHGPSPPAISPECTGPAGAPPERAMVSLWRVPGRPPARPHLSRAARCRTRDDR